MKWLATEEEVVVADTAVVDAEVAAEAVADSPARMLRLWVEVVGGRLTIFLLRIPLLFLTLALVVISTIVDSHISVI